MAANPLLGPALPPILAFARKAPSSLSTGEKRGFAAHQRQKPLYYHSLGYNFVEPPAAEFNADCEAPAAEFALRQV